MSKNYDLIVIGAGAAGMIASIEAAKNSNRVLLLEKLSQIGAKLRATGGGRCNLTNTLSNEEFMSHFGKNGRFMQDALNKFDHHQLINFFKNIGVKTHAPDGFRVFPTSHNSATIISALKDEIKKLDIDLKCSQKVENILMKNNNIIGVKTSTHTFNAPNIIIATGGLGYPSLGAQGDGYKLAKELGHSTSDLHPAMMPLRTKEQWVKNCRADTIAKVELRVDIKKYKKLKAKGDLIFTKNGIRGPVVLDFAREITPLLSKYDEVPILLNLTNGKNQEDILSYMKTNSLDDLLPKALLKEIFNMVGINKEFRYKDISGIQKEKLLNILTWTPLTVVGHDGFKMAMITRGGINLKEINPKTMQSKIINGLYFCGEVINLDGPCGGYNLQWSFSSGYLAGLLL